MAPKRSSRKLEVKKTKKTVKETVKFSFVDGDEKVAGGEMESVENEQETEKLVTSIPIEDFTANITVQIPVEEVQTPKAPETPADKTEEKKKKMAGGDDDEGSETGQEKTEEEKTEEEEEEEEDAKKKDKEKLTEKESVKEKTHKGKTVPGTGTKRKTAADTGKKPVKRRKKRFAAANDNGTGGEGYKRYVFKVLKQVHPELAISSNAMTVINMFMGDMFERISDEAAKLSQYTNRMTLSAREIQDAVRLVLPGELGKHAVAEGAKAINNYQNYGGKKGKK